MIFGNNTDRKYSELLIQPLDNSFTNVKSEVFSTDEHLIWRVYVSFNTKKEYASNYFKAIGLDPTDRFRCDLGTKFVGSEELPAFWSIHTQGMSNDGTLYYGANTDIKTYKGYTCERVGAAWYNGVGYLFLLVVDNKE